MLNSLIDLIPGARDLAAANKAIGPKTTEISGGSAGDHTVTGISKSDILWKVFERTVTTDVFVDRSSEFTITAANTINNTGGTDTTGDKLVVEWFDVS